MKFLNWLWGRGKPSFRPDTADRETLDVSRALTPKKVDAIMCIVDLVKKDSEIKILIGCTEEEKRIVYETHNESPFMKGVLIRR